jgi:hypothetical protein
MRHGRQSREAESEGEDDVARGWPRHSFATPKQGYPIAGTDQNLKDGIFNIVLNALSASALTVDETLDEVFGKASTDTDLTRVGIRVMVNQLRNAFAHNPWRPKWVIFQQHKKCYPIELDDGSKFTFDATSLNGDGVKPEHVGGLEFWTKLLQHCERLVGS